MYLAANECLVPLNGDGIRDTSVTVQVSCRGEENLHVEAEWAPDTLTFKNLNESPIEGQQFFLIPQYHSRNAFSSTRTPSNIRYSIESKNPPLCWLTWDDDVAGKFISGLCLLELGQ